MAFTFKELNNQNWTSSDGGGRILVKNNGITVVQEDGYLQRVSVPLYANGPRYLSSTYKTSSSSLIQESREAEKNLRNDVYDFLAKQTGYWDEETQTATDCAHWNYDDGSQGLPLHLVNISSGENNGEWDIEAVFEYPTYTTDDGGNKIDEAINEPGYTEPVVSDNDFTYTTALEGAHIIQGLSTIGVVPFARNVSANEFGGCIGYQGDGTFSGVDVQRPVIRLSITINRPFASLIRRSTPSGVIDPRLTISSLVGSVNNNAWLGYPTGSVFFEAFNAQVGYLNRTDIASGLKQAFWKCSYSFLIKPGRVITNGTTSVAQRGFDCAWELKSEYANQAGGSYQTTDAIFVEQIYPYANFGLLGLNLPY